LHDEFEGNCTVLLGIRGRCAIIRKEEELRGAGGHLVTFPGRGRELAVDELSKVVPEGPRDLFPPKHTLTLLLLVYTAIVCMRLAYNDKRYAFVTFQCCEGL
jgi:hypothetical protein